MINISINGDTHTFDKQVSLQLVIEKLKIDTDGIAVAINQHIISKSKWNSTTLNNSDNVLIIKATQGG
ncbi:sulfur carrier protein ThiS [Maribacter sp. 2304DJ31-5]|uniref:sulfur carrier protein ThiS n=1 Tax=Maribacter sp. 2304DJ31-5 TaxID=3386273 RepID=UPI0039BCAAC0